MYLRESMHRDALRPMLPPRGRASCIEHRSLDNSNALCRRRTATSCPSVAVASSIQCLQSYPETNNSALHLHLLSSCVKHDRVTCAADEALVTNASKEAYGKVHMRSPHSIHSRLAVTLSNIMSLVTGHSRSVQAGRPSDMVPEKLSCL